MTEEYPTVTQLSGLAGTIFASGIIGPTIGYEPAYEKDLQNLWTLQQIIGDTISDFRIYKDSTDGDLQFSVKAGKAMLGLSELNFAGQNNIDLTNNETNSIYLYNNVGALTVGVSITGFPGQGAEPHIPLGRIITSAGDYDIFANLTHLRHAGIWKLPGGAGGGLLDWHESLIDELDFTSAEPAAPTLGERYLNTGSGASSETGQTVAANDIEVWNGTNWTEITPTEGACCIVEDRDMLIGFNGSSWVDVGTFALLNEAQTFFGATDISGAQAETLTDGSNADSLHVHDTAGLTNDAVTKDKINSDVPGTGLEQHTDGTVRVKVAGSQTLTASDFTIAHNGKPVVLVTNDGGNNYTSSATTAVADGSFDGQKLTIIQIDAGAKWINLKDNANTKLAGDWKADKEEEWIKLIWDATDSDWLEVARGGNSNTSAGVRANAVGGGNCTNSGNYTGSLGGYNNVNSGANAASVGGNGNVNSGNFSGSLGGYLAKADKYGQISHAAGQFAAVGDAQDFNLALRASVLHDDGDWHDLYLDGASLLATISADKVWTFDILLVGTTQGCTKSFGFHINGVLERDGDATTLLASNITTIYDTDDTDFDAQVAADDGNDALLVQVKDETLGGDTVRWFAQLRVAEVGFPA